MLLKLGNVGFRSGSNRNFLPTDISNLALWLDASDISTITHISGALSQWNDKSGNNNHATQSLSTAQPTTNLASINNNNAIDFDGSDFMSLATALSRVNGYSVFVVTNVNDTASSKSFLSGASGSFAFRADQDEQLDIVRTDQAVVLSGTTPLATASDNIVACRTSAAGNNTYINGALANSNTTNPLYSADITTIGKKQGTAEFYFNGLIGEILVYENILSDNEMNKLGIYLSGKWGLTWTSI